MTCTVFIYLILTLTIKILLNAKSCENINDNGLNLEEKIRKIFLQILALNSSLPLKLIFPLWI